jgi:hypothetical protein
MFADRQVVQAAKQHLRLLAQKPTVVRLGTQLVPLISDVAPCGNGLSAPFSHWRVVIGEGLAKCELMSIDAIQREGPDTLLANGVSRLTDKAFTQMESVD